MSEGTTVLEVQEFTPSSFAATDDEVHSLVLGGPETSDCPTRPARWFPTGLRRC